MVRLAVLADVRGYLPALEAVLSDPDQSNIDGVIVAGDLVGGPKPPQSIRLVRSLDSWIIRGDSDAGFSRHAEGRAPPARHTSLQFALMRWGVHQLDQQALDFLASPPEQRVISVPGTQAIRVVHGSPRHPTESIYPGRDPTALSTALAETRRLPLSAATRSSPGCDDGAPPWP